MTQLSPADIIQELQATNSRLEKEAILQRAWEGGCREFFVGCQLALDSLITFGIKKVSKIEGSDPGPAPGSLTWSEFNAVAQALRNRVLTGNAARDAVTACAEASNTHEWNDWFRRILLKDLKCGLTETTINKVLKGNGQEAQAFMVPVFACQLAKDAGDNENKLKGNKLVDIKLDGCRLLTVMDKEAGTVAQYSRDGKLNENFTHLTQGLASVLPMLSQSVVLDGEVVSASFQTLMKQLNRKKNINTSDASLALFDIIPLAEFRQGEYAVSQRDRHIALCEMENMLKDATKDRVYVVPKLEINLDTPEGQAKLKEFNRETIDAGYEGIMIKDPKASYKCKRTDAWLKNKPWISVDLEVVSVEPGTPGSKFEHTMGAVVFQGVDQGKKIWVSVGSGWSEEMRDQVWKMRNKLKGRIAEIKGDALTKNQNSDDVYSLRFPVFMTWRGTKPGEKI